MLIGSGLQALATSGKFKPVDFGQIRTAGDNSKRGIYHGRSTYRISYRNVVLGLSRFAIRTGRGPALDQMRRG
jgi:hypothetical protein